MSNKAVIIDGVRSPIGTKGSALVGMRPDEIAGQVIKGLLDRNKEVIEYVSLSNRGDFSQKSSGKSFFLRLTSTFLFAIIFSKIVIACLVFVVFSMLQMLFPKGEILSLFQNHLVVLIVMLLQ